VVLVARIATVATRADFGDRGVQVHVGPVRAGLSQCGPHRQVGVQDARVRVIQDVGVEVHVRPACLRLGGAEQLVWDRFVAEQGGEPPRVAAGAVVDGAGEGAEGDAGVVFQALPAVRGPGGEFHIEQVRVHAAEDPGTAV
jgi:hypothetical protein